LFGHNGQPSPGNDLPRDEAHRHWANNSLATALQFLTASGLPGSVRPGILGAAGALGCPSEESGITAVRHHYALANTLAISGDCAAIRRVLD